MKRMYVTLGLILVIGIWALSSLGQQTSSDPHTQALKRHLQLREEIHKRMRDKLFHGLGPDDDLFKDMDEMFNDLMDDSFSLRTRDQFSLRWIESKEGRTLEVTPKEKDQQLDISVEKGFITIKGKTENTSFSNAFNVPDDCDASRVKMVQDKEKILMHFPYKTTKSVGPFPRKKIVDERIPLPAPSDAVEI